MAHVRTCVLHLIAIACWRAVQCDNLLRERQLLDAKGHMRPDLRPVPDLRALQRYMHCPAAVAFATAIATAAKWQRDLPGQD